MNRCVVLFAIVSLMTGCQKVELKEFSPDGSFRILMPEKKDEKQQEFGGIPGKVWLAESRDGAFYLGVGELPNLKLTKETADLLLKEAQRKGIQDTKAELVSESNIQLGDYPGLQFEAKLRIPMQTGGDVEGTMRTRLYLADGKLFILQALGRPDWVTTPEIGQFLDSLKITK